MKDVRLRLTGRQHADLQAHLFPGDGKEAVAVALCGRAGGMGEEFLLVHKLHLIPYEKSRRHASYVHWSPLVLEPFLREAAKYDFGILKIHSHPKGHTEFSTTDDESDRKVFESVFGWLNSDRPHASAIMLSDGRMIGRSIHPGIAFSTLKSIAIAGDDVRFWFQDQKSEALPKFSERHAQLFGSGTTRLLKKLRIAVVGCSGTGSVVVEQLARLGVGEMILVDHDIIEEKNLNRIVGATLEHAQKKALKVDVLAQRVEEMGLGTRVYKFPTSLEEPGALRAVSSADLVVGCMDSLVGRHVLCRLARYYLLPYVDVGVKLEALEDGTINQIAGSVHYFQPDGSDFLDRSVFSAEALEAEGLLRYNPNAYWERLERGYIRGVNVDRPAVISVNMLFASLAVNELLARIHPFRLDDNAQFASTRFSLSHFHLEQESDEKVLTARFLESVGRGDVIPPLGMPTLEKKAREIAQ